MKIRLERSGGLAYFPNLDKPIVVDTETLDPEAAKRIEQLVQRIDFFSLASNTTAPPGAADYYVYTLAVQSATDSHTVTVTDHAAAPGLLELIEEIQRAAPR
jgi:phosphoenolpyruvate-protein kinase (PTS system EI component)